MISVDSLKGTLACLLGNKIQGNFPFVQVAKALNKQEELNNIKLSAYGYLLYGIDHYGASLLYNNILASGKLIEKYAREAVKYRDDMPVMLVNAAQYVEHVFSLIPDTDACFRRLEDMTFPYVLYTLFAGGGQKELVQRYRDEFEEVLHRYPSTLDMLPASYQAVGREVSDADIK